MAKFLSEEGLALLCQKIKEEFDNVYDTIIDNEEVIASAFNDIKKYIDNRDDKIINGCDVILSGNGITIDTNNVSYLRPTTIQLQEEEYYSLKTIEVIMNGKNVTSSVWNNETKQINISKVTGDIRINTTSIHLITTSNDFVLSNKAFVYNQPYTTEFVPTNGKQLLPASVIVTMGDTDITDTSYNIETNQIIIPSVNDDVEIITTGVTVDSAYKPLLYVATRGRIDGNMLPTPYYPNSNTRLVMDVDMVMNTYAMLYAVKNPNTAPSAEAPQFCFWPRITSTSNYSYAWGSKKQDATSTAAGRMMMGQRTLFTCDKGKFTYTNQAGDIRNATLNGGTWDLAGTSYNLKLFAYNNTGANHGYCSDGKMYRVTIDEGNDPLLDYIPVEKLSDSTCGLYDIVNGNFLINNSYPSNYIKPFVAVTRTLTNVANSFLSTTDAGNNHRAVYGKEWSVKYTPSEGYTFNSDEATFQFIVNNKDVTNEVATYDSTTDTWTASLTAHWGDTISVIAIAQADENAPLSNPNSINNTNPEEEII